MTAPPAAPPASAAPAAGPPVAAAAGGSGTVQPVPVEPGPAPDLGTPPKESAAPPPEMTLSLELDGGLITRLGDAADYGYTSSERGGIMFGPGVWFSGSRVWSAGVMYQRSRIGSDRTDPIEGSLTIRRDLDALWLGGRAFPWRTDAMGLFIALGLGMSWQHVNADGTRPATDAVSPDQPFSCSGSDGPGIALGGGVGLDVDISNQLAFVTLLNAAAHRHTSDVVEGCAPGSGSVTSVGAQIGFAYRFDLEDRGSRAPRRQSASRPRPKL
ncbi:MAG: hypothetical protein U0263_39070 [Polyangiaceae bacterium]